jgi:NAD(P)-dependent dehydrogenase (short-subunit alcohol dehydrogenase family)
MSLEFKRVVVVGGTSGIGLATARAAAVAGAEVIVASASQSRVRRAVAEFSTPVTGLVLDVTDGREVESFFAEVGELDHLVYTAGEALVLSALADLDVDRAREFFEVRYFGALGVVRTAAPRVREGGSVTLTTGIANARPQTGWSIGASVCGAVEGLTKALAVELAPIRVNVVSPGVVRSPLWSSIDDSEVEQLYKNVAATVPVGHVGEADEVARAFLYCMGQTYGTGLVITVDGGAVLV